MSTKSTRGAMSLTVTLSLWSATGVSRAAQYEWTFSHGNLSTALGNGALSYADGATTAGLTTFGTTDGTTVPHIGGQPASYMHVPAFTGQGNGYYLKLNDSAPNGGGYINQYTAMYDVYVPGTPNWTALFNTDPANSNDADWYIAPDGGLGIGGGGYSPAGTIVPNTWYRIGFSADLVANTASIYVNGLLVKQNSAAGYEVDGDGRFTQIAIPCRACCSSMEATRAATTRTNFTSIVCILRTRA